MKPNEPAGRYAGVAAWLLCAVFYFYQYSLRSAPGAMVADLTRAFGLTTLGISTLLGLYYYTYAPASLVAGAVLDRYGAKYSVPAGIILVAIGCILFGSGGQTHASLGRLLQGAGSAFGFVGAVYVATKSLPARNLALAVGATQMFGMAGGSAGLAPVNNLINVQGIPWQAFWMAAGIAGVVLAIVLVILLPGEAGSKQKEAAEAENSFLTIFATYKTVFSNPQSYLCGICAGLLFMPTTIGGMIWGASCLTRGLNVDTLTAGRIVASVLFGWIIGCPLLGYISDKIGLRRPVLIGGAITMVAALSLALHVESPPFSKYAAVPVALLLGIASGAAMIPYSIIKEVNPDHVKGSTAGAMNFIVFMMSAQLSPVIGLFLMDISKRHQSRLQLTDFQLGLAPLVAGVILAVVIALFIKETGPAAKKIFSGKRNEN